MFLRLETSTDFKLGQNAQKPSPIDVTDTNVAAPLEPEISSVERFEPIKKKFPTVEMPENSEWMEGSDAVRCIP